MRKLSWFIFAVLVTTIGVPYVSGDSITDGTLNFTVTSGSPAPVGSFVFDNTTNTFTSFAVDWNGAVYNFATTAITLADLGSFGAWCVSAPSGAGPCDPEQFLLFPGAVTPFPLMVPNSEFSTQPDAGIFTIFTDERAAANGTYTVTETPVATVPEPSSLVLMLLGCSALGVRVRRKHGAPASKPAFSGT